MKIFSNNIIIGLISFFLFLFAFFTFAIIGAGSHDGHFGLFDSSDSFDLFLIIYYCFVGILEINHLNYHQKLHKSNLQKYFIKTFYGLLIVVGLIIFILTVIEDNTTYERQRINEQHYIMIIIPLIMLVFGFYKMKETTRPNTA
jgi:hypothetical protein